MHLFLFTISSEKGLLTFLVLDFHHINIPRRVCYDLILLIFWTVIHVFFEIWFVIENSAMYTRSPRVVSSLDFDENHTIVHRCIITLYWPAIDRSLNLIHILSDKMSPGWPRMTPGWSRMTSRRPRMTPNCSTK